MLPLRTVNSGPNGQSCILHCASVDPARWTSDQAHVCVGEPALHLGSALTALITSDLSKDLPRLRSRGPFLSHSLHRKDVSRFSGLKLVSETFWVQQPWANYFTSLCIVVLICKMGAFLSLSLQGCHQDQCYHGPMHSTRNPIFTFTGAQWQTKENLRVSLSQLLQIFPKIQPYWTFSNPFCHRGPLWAGSDWGQKYNFSFSYL